MKILITFLFLLFALPLQGQIAEIQGMLADSLTDEPFPNCQVRIVGQDTVVVLYTDFDGFYAVKINKMGNYSVEVACMNIKATVYDIPVKIDKISFFIISPNFHPRRFTKFSRRLFLFFFVCLRG